MSATIFLSVFALLSTILSGISLACTDFRIIAEDGSVVVGRSMEFAMSTDSEVVGFHRGAKRVSMLPDGKRGIGWTAKYGYLGVNVMGLKEVLVDGINEAGLTVSYLWFTESQYQEASGGDWIVNGDLSHWLLGNFSAVDEVKKEIPRLKVVGVYVPELGTVPGFHLSVHDATGKGIVVEFIKGETRIYDNPAGVMTNKPTFDWHLTNLRNYIHLDPYDKEEKTIMGVKMSPTGSGSGWLGMPGDWTSASRFVRTAFIVHSADPVKDAAKAVNLAEHILNTVDIPMGVVKARQPESKDQVDYTQWTVIKDLTNKILYFRSYQDLNLKKVHMDKLDFSPGIEMKAIRIESGIRTILDITEKLRNP